MKQGRPHYLSRKSDPERLASYILQFSLVLAWRAVSAVSAPVTQVFSLYVASWRAASKLGAWLCRVVSKLAAWLASPAWGGSKAYGEFKRWHVVLGEWRGRLAAGAGIGVHPAAWPQACW
jgi:hypothetical protein